MPSRDVTLRVIRWLSVNLVIPWLMKRLPQLVEHDAAVGLAMAHSFTGDSNEPETMIMDHNVAVWYLSILRHQLSTRMQSTVLGRF